MPNKITMFFRGAQSAIKTLKLAPFKASSTHAVEIFIPQLKNQQITWQMPKVMTRQFSTAQSNQAPQVRSISDMPNGASEDKDFKGELEKKEPLIIFEPNEVLFKHERGTLKLTERGKKFVSNLSKQSFIKIEELALRIYPCWQQSSSRAKIASIFSVILISIAGYYAYQQYEKELEENDRLKKMPSINNISLPSHYIQREKQLGEIHQALNEGSVVVISGMTGEGKSTLAEGYCDIYLKEQAAKNPVIYLLDAQNTSSLWQSLEELAKKLDSSLEANLREKEDEKTRRQLIEATIQNKLLERKYWTVVLDNVEDCDHELDNVIGLLKKSGSGRIIITSQNSNLHLNYKTKEVDLEEGLSIEDSRKLFDSIFSQEEVFGFKDIMFDQEGFELFFHELEGNTLALKQAFLYMRNINQEREKAGLPIFRYTDYLKLIQGELKIIQTELEYKAKIVKEKILYATIQLSIQRALSLSGRDQFKLMCFIGLCALIDSFDIPRDFLNEFAESFIKNNQINLVQSDAIERFVYYLSAFSLLTYQRGQQKPYPLKIHKAVQQVALNLLKQKLGEDSVFGISKEQLLQRKPYDSDVDIEPLQRICLNFDSPLLAYMDWVINFTLLYLKNALKQAEYGKISSVIRHVESLVHNQQGYLNNLALARDYFNLVHAILDSYDALAYYSKSILLAEKELEKARKIYGNKDQTVEKLLEQIGLAFWSLGGSENLVIAEKHHLESLTIRKERLGEEHPDVAESLSDLGLIYWSRGGYENWQIAKNYFEKSLAIRRKKLNKYHLDLAQSLNNLALVYTAFNNQESLLYASELHKEALEIRIHELGNEHPDVAQSYNNLASVYRRLAGNENLKLAKQFCEKALDIVIKKLGEKHRNIVYIQFNLAKIYEDIGGKENLQLACDLYEKANSLAIITLGEKHPITLKLQSMLIQCCKLLDSENNKTVSNSFFTFSVN